MNKELELEAEEYAKTDWGVNHKILSEDSYDFKRVEISKQDFIAGATSKYVEQQKLEFAIEQLKFLGSVHDECVMSQRTRNKIQELR